MRTPGDRADDGGEFSLIARIRARLPAGPGVTIGPGDDAAAVETGPATLLAADMLVEGVHFDFAFSSAADAGYKAVAVNVSDLAAMGGRARYLLVSLGLAPGATTAFVDSLYDGMSEAAAAFGCAIVGGDIVGADQTIVSIAAAGDPGPAGVVGRSGAREGDVLCVTGALGAAAAGLGVLRAQQDPAAAALIAQYPSLIDAHRRPAARVAEGPAAAAAGATAMIDVSDGFAADAGHIATESNLGLVIEADALPIAAGVADAAAFLGADPLRIAAGGGDDYELAIAVPPDRVASLREALAPVPVTVAGAFGGAERVLILGGERLPLEALGWEHRP